jgi:hypothetical protein
VTDSFSLTLDTTAPAVVFGSAVGTAAGEFFQIAYTTDEPLEWATLVDAAGQHLALTIDVDSLSVLLPPDVADGWALIQWADDVGNENVLTQVVLLSGVVAVPEPSTGGMPQARRREVPLRRKLRARSTIVVSSRTRHAVVAEPRTVRAREVVTVVSSTSVRADAHYDHDAIAVTARTTIAVGTHRATTSASVATETAIHRRDDPSTEAFLLDLL